jgi:putative membrane protein
MRFAKIGFLAAPIAFALSAGGVFAQKPAQLTDPQIAHLAYTAGEIDIKAAQQAEQKSQNNQVRQFADTMVRDHTAVNDKAWISLRD